MYILELVILVGIFIGAIYLSKFYKNKRNMQIVEKFTDYIGILTYFKEKSYDVIYRDKIFSHSLDGFKLNDKEFNETTQEFVKLVIKFIGPRFFNEFTYFYGNEDTFMIDLVEYFHSKYEDDQIRKSSLENLSNKDDFPEGNNNE